MRHSPSAHDRSRWAIPKAGLSSDLDALAAYVNSLSSFAPSPWRPSPARCRQRPQQGASFVRLNCATCHAAQAFSNSSGNALPNVGTIKPSSGSRLGAPLTGLDVPTLRDVWATAPYLHDGSAPRSKRAISAHTTLDITRADADRSPPTCARSAATKAPRPCPA